MRGLARTLCIWWLALALPVQGWAAAAMLFCGTGATRHVHAPASVHAPAQVHTPAQALAVGQRVSSGAVVHPDHPAMANEAVPHCHGHAASPPDHGSPKAENADGPDLMSPHGPCSVCIDCCSMLALPAASALAQSVPPAEELHALRVQPVTSRVTDTPERPPRPHLA
jgi:hypothetical protein